MTPFPDDNEDPNALHRHNSLSPRNIHLADHDDNDHPSSHQGDNDDDDDDDVDRHHADEEATGLMTSEPLPHRRFQGEFFEDETAYYDNDVDGGDDEEDRYFSGSFRILVLSMAMVLIVATLAVLLPGIGTPNNTFEALRTPARIPVEYSCPSTTTTSTSTDGSPPPNDVPENYNAEVTSDYMNTSLQITNNMTEFLHTFRESNFDGWGHSYEYVKQNMYHFKSTYFTPYLTDGSTIYESACGIGLNLYMTLEILQETANIENLFVYGNDYVQVSVDKANAVMDHIAPAHGRKGILCPGDSAHLDFVPSNAFDLVYTGYISPLLDPLNFDLSINENFYNYYTTICKSDQDDWAKQKLKDIAQQRQNDWYGEWVAEMARIAKPSVPVIIEQVSPRYCDAFFDWGGVDKTWWINSATNNTYGWNVHPESLVFEDDAMFRERYHVFMLKNGKREP